jgi:transcriptional regulator with XRE-family HTH domain
MDFGRRLAKIREAAGHTQSSLAEAAGLSQSAISQLESGARHPTYDTIRHLAKAMKISPAYLMGGDLQGLSGCERALLRRYRTLSGRARRECERLVEDLCARETAQQKLPTSSRPDRGDATMR